MGVVVSQVVVALCCFFSCVLLASPKQDDSINIAHLKLDFSVAIGARRAGEMVRRAHELLALLAAGGRLRPARGSTVVVCSSICSGAR